MWNKIVFELNLYDLAHRSYGLFSNDTKAHEIDVSAMVIDY